MAHCNTVLNQFLHFVPRHEIESLSAEHHQGRRFRKAGRWSQFVMMAFAQLSGRCSLRDVIAGLSSQAHKLYHLGAGVLARSTLARINNDKPAALYEALFGRLLGRCQTVAPGHGFRFKNKLYSLDATTIDLCLSVFPWARFRRAKGGIKLNVGLNHGATCRNLSVFMKRRTTRSTGRGYCSFHPAVSWSWTGGSRTMAGTSN